MSMSIILNARVWLPHDSKDIEVTVKGKNVWIPDDLSGVCSLSVRLGSFYGYELAEYIRMGTTDGFSETNDWLFSADDADIFLVNARDDIRNGTVSFATDLEEFVEVLEKALNSSYDEFEVSLWY